MSKKARILGIETSCDETAAAVLQYDGKNLQALSSAVASQVELHKLTGGVVPEVAAREHVTTIMPVVELALKRAGLPATSHQLQANLDAIAVTAGPGLLPALMVGVDTANALSLATAIPVIPVQHITGHIYANFINDEVSGKSETRNSKSYKTSSSNVLASNLQQIRFPLLALVVSGGHTEFILLKNHLNFKKVGATLDDAAGECFDKCAKILGLPYPGGPQISKWAAKGNPKAFDFPRPMINSGDLNFSFAGLKTAVLYKVKDLQPPGHKLQAPTINDLAASIQEAIVETLIYKTRLAIKKYKPKSFTLGGGVAANRLLRERVTELLAADFPNLAYIPTKVAYATDNAVMIAAVGAMKFRHHKRPSKFASADPNWEL